MLHQKGRCRSFHVICENILIRDASPRQDVILTGVMFMRMLYCGIPVLRNKMKKNLLVILGTILLILQIYAVQAAPQAIFVTHGSEKVRTSGNDFYPGTYPAQYGYFVSIQNTPDDSGTVLGNITYEIDADNIIEYDQMQYANKQGTSIQWIFPQNVSLGENTFISSSARTDYIYQRYIPITVHRWTNRSVFATDGDQLASFSVSYDNFSLDDANATFTHVFGGIATNENSKFNASIVPGSFTTNMPLVNNPMALNNSHHKDFSNSTPVRVNQNYNFSVVIHIQLKDPAVTVTEYYPGFTTLLMGGNSSFDPVSSFSADSPSSMLPKYTRYARGSTNISNQWYYSFDFTRGVSLNESWTSSNSSNTRQKIGVYQNGVWYIDTDGSGTWNTGDRANNFGANGWTSKTGDWNGDGKTEIGVYKDGVWYLDYNGNGAWDTGVDNVSMFGALGWTPIVGDWNGNGKTKIGVYKDGVWYLDSDGSGTWNIGDTATMYGATGWTPVIGNWNGDATGTKIGVYKDGAWYLDYDGSGTWNAGDMANNFGAQAWQSVVADWNGDGKTEMSVYKDGMWYLDNDGSGTWNAGDMANTFGASGWASLPGDWNGDGNIEIGVTNGQQWYLDSNGNGAWDNGVDNAYSFGAPGWTPVVGKWG